MASGNRRFFAITTSGPRQLQTARSVDHYLVLALALGPVHGGIGTGVEGVQGQVLDTQAGQGRLAAGKERGELFAANTPEQVATAQRGSTAVGQTLQDLVAHLVTVAVIDQLEVVQVDQQKGQRAAEFAGLLELALGALEEMSAVAALGQHIGGGQAVQFAFQLLLLGDVLGDTDNDLRPASGALAADEA